MCNTVIIDESRDVHRQFDKHVDPQLRLVLATTCVKLVQYSHIRIRNLVLCYSRQQKCVAFHTNIESQTNCTRMNTNVKKRLDIQLTC